MDILRNFSVLRNEFLVGLIQNFDNDTHGLQISTIIFHYFLSDKLVFQGINVSELRNYARFGQHIGYIGAFKNTLDYIIVENKKTFIEISKKICTPMHLIQYQNERFYLIQSTGSQEAIPKFIDRNHCQIDRLPIVFQTAEKESFELFEIASLFSHMCKQTNNWELWEKFKDATTSLLPVGKQITAIVYELFQTLICCERDWKKLEYVALSTLFRNLLINSEICGLQKYIDIGLLQQISGVLYFVHDTLAWYFISKLILSESTVWFVDLNCLRTTLLHNCFEANNVTEFGGIIFCDEISSFTFKNRRLFDFVDKLLSHQYNAKTFQSRIRLILSERFDYSEKWIYACVQANQINILNTILACEIHSVLFESEELVVLAVMFGGVEIIKTITEKFITQTGKDIHEIRVKLQANASTDALNISVLHVAGLRGDHKVMGYLLQIAKVDFNCVDGVGDSVLIKAVRYHRSARLYEALIRAGAEIQNKNHKNNMVLHVAAEEGNLTAIRYFIFLGMDVNARCKANTTPLHCVVDLAPKNAHTIIEVLLEHGADVNAATSQKARVGKYSSLKITNKIQNIPFPSK
ncbi:unnamed protein product [Orchesella dallaii]|uniref:Ankyrin repeat protein n=1 Tax=Orchesella dallaii TaxID=48710 RepID=A0ABP1RYA7_9HEXA